MSRTVFGWDSFSDPIGRVFRLGAGALVMTERLENEEGDFYAVKWCARILSADGTTVMAESYAEGEYQAVVRVVDECETIGLL